jgi:hypothetical protein
MTHVLNKLCNKQDEFFVLRRSYLQKGQGSSNEFFKTYKSFYLMKSSLFYNNILIFYPIL